VNLVAERVNRGLSVLEAAEQIGVARGTLSRAEQGVMPSPRNAKKVADFYGVQVTDIWPVDREEAGA
jgi:transcriptional regulator with XRE-family HTH domain